MPFHEQSEVRPAHIPGDGVLQEAGQEVWGRLLVQRQLEGPLTDLALQGRVDPVYGYFLHMKKKME